MTTSFDVSFEGDEPNQNEETKKRNKKPASTPREQADRDSKTVDRKELYASAKRLGITGYTRMTNESLKKAIEANTKPDVMAEARKIETRPSVPPEDRANYRKFLLAEAKDLNINNRIRMKNEDLAKAIEEQRSKGPVPKVKRIRKPKVTPIASEDNIPELEADDLDDSFDVDSFESSVPSEAVSEVPSSPPENWIGIPDLLSYEGGGGEPPKPPEIITAEMPDDEDDPLFNNPQTDGVLPEPTDAELSKAWEDWAEERRKVREGKTEDPLFNNPQTGGVPPEPKQSDPPLFSHDKMGGDPPDLPDLPFPINPKGNVKADKKAAEKFEDKQKRDDIRRKRMEITAAKRRADKQNTINAKRERLVRREQREVFTESAKLKKVALKKEADRGESDRLIRRLTTFGIGRAAGIDGGLVTALAEIFLFQPEIDLANQKLEAGMAAIDQELSTSTGTFETAKTETSVNRDKQSLDIAETVDEARLNLAEGADVDPAEVERVIQAIVNEDVQIDPSGVNASPGSNLGGSQASQPVTSSVGQPGNSRFRTGGGGRGQGTGGSSSTSPNWTYYQPGGTGGGTVPPNATTMAGGSPGGPGGPGQLATITSGFVKSMASSTAAMLGVYVGLTALKSASEAVEKGFRHIGKVLTSPDTIGPMAQSVGGAGKIAGMGAGAVIGGMMTAGNPVGMVAGAIIGKAISNSIIDPLVGLIETAEAVIGSAAKNSIGPKTIAAKVESSLLALEQRINNSFRIDDDTAQFIEISSEFSRAINDLKTSLIPIIAPVTNSATQSFTMLAKLVEIATLILDGVMTLTGLKLFLQANNWFMEKMIGGLDVIIWLLGGGSSNAQNTSITNGIYNFFGGNPNNAVSGSMNNNINRNTPVGQNPNPNILSNLLSLP